MTTEPTEVVQAALAALFDVRGVEGALYTSRDGGRMVRALPAIYDGEPLDGLGAQLARLIDALGEVTGEPEGLLLRTPGHAVYLRPTEHGVLMVLATFDVNLPALKRGASLVARRLPDLERSARDTAAGTTPGMRASAPPALPVRAPTPAAHAASLPVRAPPPMAREATPPPLPALPPPAPRQSTSGLIDPRPVAPRASVPGAPASPAHKWRGSTVK